MILSVSRGWQWGGTKGCFMVNIKGEKASQPNLEIGGTRKQAAAREAEKLQNSHFPPLFTFILMANLLSSVLCEMIRARCFCEKCKLLDLPAAPCHIDRLFWEQWLPKQWNVLAPNSWKFPLKNGPAAVCGYSPALISRCWLEWKKQPVNWAPQSRHIKHCERLTVAPLSQLFVFMRPFSIKTG